MGSVGRFSYLVCDDAAWDSSKEKRGYAAIPGPNITSFGGVGWTES